MIWEESRDYRGKPVSGRYIESKLKGTPGMEVCFDIQGHKKHITFWLSEKAEEKTMRLLGDLKFNGDFENPAFGDVEVQLECKHEEYNGKPQEKWSFWVEQQAAPLEISKAKRLQAMFKSAVGNVPVPKPTTAPVMPKPSAPPSAPPAPPVAKGPPPRPAPLSTPAQSLATDEASAWAWVNANRGTMSDDDLNAKWIETVENVNPTKPEGWHKVCEVFAIPF
jgi:hypothetical protein